MRSVRQPRSAQVVLLSLAAALALLLPALPRQALAAAPPAPTALRVVPNGNGVYVTFMPAPGATSYQLLRDGMRLPSDDVLPTGSEGRKQITDDTTTRGQHYVYSVRAVSSAGYSAFVSTALAQWTDDGSRTWLSSRYGPAECARTGAVPDRRLICTMQTTAGWQIFRTPRNVAWGNPENRAWFTANGAINYCNLVGARPDRMKVSCLELGETGWGAQSTSPPTDWGIGKNRTWLDSAAGPALCARTGTADDRHLVCTVRTVDGWKTYRTEHQVDWGYTQDRMWLTVGGKITYCATVGNPPGSPKVACVALGSDGWEEQSVSPVTDWGDPVQRTWVASAQGPALCARTERGGFRSLVCTTRTSTGWRIDRAPQVVDWGYQQYRAWLGVRGAVDYCGIVGDIPDNTRLACLELGPTGWGQQSISPVTDWGDPTNRTWIVGQDGPALCGRTGQSPDDRVTCTVLTSDGWVESTSPSTVDFGYDAERSWALDHGQISFCDQVGDYSVDQHVACVKLGDHGWGEQIISPRTDWGDNQP